MEIKPGTFIADMGKFYLIEVVDKFNFDKIWVIKSYKSGTAKTFGYRIKGIMQISSTGKEYFDKVGAKYLKKFLGIDTSKLIKIFNKNQNYVREQPRETSEIEKRINLKFYSLKEEFKEAFKEYEKNPCEEFLCDIENASEYFRYNILPIYKAMLEIYPSKNKLNYPAFSRINDKYNELKELDCKAYALQKSKGLI